MTTTTKPTATEVVTSVALHIAGGSIAMRPWKQSHAVLHLLANGERKLLSRGVPILALADKLPATVTIAVTTVSDDGGTTETVDIPLTFEASYEFKNRETGAVETSTKPRSRFSGQLDLPGLGSRNVTINVSPGAKPGTWNLTAKAIALGGSGGGSRIMSLDDL